MTLIQWLGMAPVFTHLFWIPYYSLDQKLPQHRVERQCAQWRARTNESWVFPWRCEAM